MQKRVKIKFEKIEKNLLKGSQQIFCPSSCLKSFREWGIDKIKVQRSKYKKEWIIDWILDLPNSI